MTSARPEKKDAIGHTIARAGALIVLACSGIAAADPPGTGWQLRWADEFNGSALDPIKWNTNYPWGPTDNHEAYMSPDHVAVGGGLLNLTATRGIPPGAPTTTLNGSTTYPLNYTSGAVNTSGKLNFTYGYVEARLKMPATLGTWPAFWTHQHTWPPEIDIQETPFPTSNAMWQYYATYHYGVWQSPRYYGSGAYAVGTNVTAGFHDYAVDWEPDHLTFYFDEHRTFMVTDAAAVAQSANMYLILNLAVGGWPGEPPASAPFPATYQADWVRVWQHAPAATVSTWTHAGNGAWNWDTDTYWDAGAPHLGGQTAVFGDVAAAGVQINWVGSKTVGGLVFRSDANYTLGGPGQSLMMANPTGRSYIDMLSGAGSHSIASRLELYNDVSIRNYTNVPFTVAGGIIGPGELSLESGQINLSGAVAGIGNIDIGTGARVTLNGSIRAPALTILGGGTLDLTRGAIAINYPPGASPVSTIRGYLLSGYAGGAWTGTGITTSAADATHTLGYADAANAVVVSYALVGDLNLDGRVDFSDLLTLVQHYGQSGAGWDQGDVNYDGAVGFDDLLALTQNYGSGPATTQLADTRWSHLVTVPEPFGLSTVLLFARIARRRSPHPVQRYFTEVQR